MNRNFKLKLADITTITAGHPFRGAIPEKHGSGVRTVQMKDVSTDNEIKWESILETDIAGKKQPDWLKKGDILFAARGNRNYAVMIDRDYDSLICAPHFYVVRVKLQTLLPDFLVWQLNQKPAQSYFRKEAEGSVTKSIRRTVLENTPITVPVRKAQIQILDLHKVLLQEKQLYSALVHNTEKIMAGIASQLTTELNK